MKALPKRKGNSGADTERPGLGTVGLNESPSQKEGKELVGCQGGMHSHASMKPLPKKEGKSRR